MCGVHSNSASGIYKFGQASLSPSPVSSIGVSDEGWVMK